jgi:3-methyladenine DNA glycosylase/8-oxoguanine DNA glycosylase
MKMPPAEPVLRRFTVTPPVPFRLVDVVRSHGWVELAPWRWDGAVLARRERIDAIAGELAVRQTAAGRVVVTWRAPAAVSRAAVLAVVERALSWDWDHAPFCALAGALAPAAAAQVAGGAGRLLRGTSFYEDFVKTVCTINTSWAGTCKMTANLVAHLGRGHFPTPRQIVRAGEAKLREACRLGFRAPVLIGCTERLLEDGAIDAQGHGAADALGYDYLVALKGIGPYAAAHCRVLLHDFSRLPVDSVVGAHLREALELTSEAAIEAHFAPWGDYRFLAYRLRRNALKQAAGAPPDGW